MMVTPHEISSTRLAPLTFGSFLPPQFQSIVEEDEDSGSESALQGSLHLESFGGPTTTMTPAVRRLQCSDSSAQPTPPELTDYKANRLPQKGKSLNYVPPTTKDGKIFVHIDAEDIKPQEDYMKTALIGYIVGDTPYVKSLEAYVANTWKGVKKPQILAHDEGYYIFRFDSVEDCEKVLDAGPYTFHNKPFVIQKWTIDFQFDPDCLTTIPLWVIFPGLPVGYWSIEALSKVASAIGRPRYTDTFTAKMEKIAYARILVDVDVSQPLRESIELQTPQDLLHQTVDYDWKPKFWCKLYKVWSP
ncbi:uncharacterized protein LOC132631441 [Lycium barbarum]|uniref:uncharacterized protein LOC132631441 n=1 Tax=Lycium barbarum TaxID=112863 RepID=UPI00293ECD04|nr:uncharacterized protein LOC132631441 [Lycium barbarum]